MGYTTAFMIGVSCTNLLNAPRHLAGHQTGQARLGAHTRQVTLVTHYAVIIPKLLRTTVQIASKGCSMAILRRDWLMWIQTSPVALDIQLCSSLSIVTALIVAY